MVEIEVYSTVGALWYELPIFGVKCGKDAVEVCGTAEERATNGVKDVVKIVVFCALQNSHARRLVNFWYNG